MPTGSLSNTATAHPADGCKWNRRALRWLAATACCIALLAITATSVSADDELTVRVQVRALIQQLNSETRAERITAERGLVALGPDALAHLPAPDLLPNVSVRQAVRRVRVTLERQASEESVKASTVTLSGEFPLSKIVQEIETQTANQIVPVDVASEQLARKFSVRWDKTPFWKVIGRLEDDGCHVAFDDVRRFVLRTTGKPREQTKTSVLEAFRILAGPISTRSFSDDEFVLKCPIAIQCEPRLRPLFLRLNTAFFRLETADGTRLEPFDQNARLELPLGIGGRTATFELTFVSDGPVAGPFHLTGLASMLTAALEQPIVFRDLAEANGVARRRGGVTVVLTKSDVFPFEDRQRVRVEVRVSYDVGASAFESHQTWVFHNSVALQRPGAEPISPEGFETLFQGDGSVGVAYQFIDDGRKLDDVTFVYTAPTLLINVPLKIELDGLRSE